MLEKLGVEALEFALGVIERSFTRRNDQLLRILNALAVLEDGLQRESKSLHVTLISFASVCSGELVS